MKQIAFILHGKIKKRQQFIAEAKAFFADSASLAFKITEFPDHANELAYHAVKEGATHVICVGGDGSLNEVVNGVMRVLDNPFVTEKEKHVMVGVLPHGTGNDFSRTMGIAYNIESLKKWIEDDSFRIIDVGRAEYRGKDNKDTSRYFINITDIGIGGAIVHGLSNSSKVLGSFLTYQMGILKALFTYKKQPVKVSADTFNYERSIMSLIVADGRYFAGGLGIAPDALPDDKLFSIVIIGEVSTWTYLKNLGKIKKSIKIDHPELKYLSASEIFIESPSGPLPIDMDGEFVGFSPVKIKVVPAALRFIGPK